MLFNAAPSLSTFKAVFRRVATGLVCAVIGPKLDDFLGTKVVTPNEKLVLIPFGNENEAHYVCAILNSSIARLIAKSYVVEIQISAHVLEHIKVPKYNPTSEIHLRLADLSKECHKLVFECKEDELTKVEDEIDKIVAQLYGLTDEELEEVKKSLAILEGKEVEEEEIEEEPKEVKVDFLDAVVRPNAIGSFEVAVSNPLKDKVTIELQLPEYPAKFETDKEEEKIRVKVPPLEIGEYKVPYKILTSEGVVEGNFTLYVKEEKRHRARDALASKLHELLGE